MGIDVLHAAVTHTTRGKSSAPAPVFFETIDAWRAWLEANHARATELSVGFWKRGTGKPSLTWPESVDGALAFGWIDGVRHSIDAESYRIRFTPRKPGSNWSQVNVRRVKELEALGLMHPAGLAAFAGRDEAAVAYSYEQRKAPTLDPAFAARFKKHEKAFSWFSARPPGYQRTATHWVMSAKQQATRERRFEVLVQRSAEQKNIPMLVPRPGK